MSNATKAAPRHFLDLTEVPTSELRNMLAASVSRSSRSPRNSRCSSTLTAETAERLAISARKPSAISAVSSTFFSPMEAR